MTQIKKLERKALSWFLALAMVLSTFAGIVPGMSLTAKAADATLLTTITATGENQASYSPENVATVEFTNCIYERGGWTAMSGSIKVNAAKGYTITKCLFYNDSGTVIDNEAPFEMSYSRYRPVTTKVEVYGYAPSAAVDKTALNNAITAAETLYNSIKDNTDYADIANTFQTAINTAKGVAESDEVDQDAVDAATTTITTAKTTAVVGMINKLPVASDVTTSDKTTIEAVRAAYASLSETEQGKVDANTLKKLTDAEAALKDVIDTAAANTVSEKITALKAADEVTTADKTDIEAARAAYEALTDDQKAKVSADTLKKLTDAEAALAVEEVKEAINTLPAANTVTSSNEEDIVAARTAYGNLTDAQKTEVGADALAKLEACEVALAIAKLPEATSVTTENKDAIEAARTAYNALTDEQKTTVGNDALEKLEACEVALAIAELPEADSVTTDNKDAIEAARAAYDALTDAQKTAVGTDALAKLEAVEVALVNKMIDALPEADSVTTDNKDAIEAARAAYDALTPEQQAKVNEDPSVLAYLQTAEAALAIAELPAASKVTVNDKKAIVAARDAYDALTKEQQAKISADALKKLTDAEDKLLIIETVSELVSDEAKAGEVTNKINNSLPTADEITLKDETKVAAARMSYELLTDAQKNLVSEETLKKLEAAEKKISDLKEQAALDAVKDSAIERLDVYAEARAKSDATADEKAAYDKAVADGKDAINDATSQEAVATALTDAKALVNEAIAKIEKDRADAAEAAAEMAAADKAVADADKAAEDAAAAADKAASDQYASDADKKAINDAKAEVEKAVKDAKDLPANATAEKKTDAAKAIEDAVKALNEAVDTAEINSAAAKAAAEEEADKEAQLDAAKTTANNRLEDFSDAKALSNMTKAEKEAFDKAVAEGKAAIDAAKDVDAVNAALKKAKTDMNNVVAKIEKDRAAEAKAKSVKTVTVNVKTVNAKAIDKAVKMASGSNKYVTSIVLGKKVKKISKAAFKTYKKVKTLTVKTKKLKKKAVKNSLKGSKVTKIKVKVGTKKVNKKYVKNYKKIFKKKNSGKKVKVTL